jgi:twitching motility protein PilT
MDYPEALKKYLGITVEKNASDIHLVAGYPPIIRINGELWAIPKEASLAAKDSQGLAFALMTPEQQNQFLKFKEIDFSYAFEGRERFRVNVFFQRGCISCAMRLISTNIRTVSELGLPPVMQKFIESEQGFVLVTGPTSHGKSTTLAALVDAINHTRCDHIITIEDPIEYLFTPDASVIEQRELNSDTYSFSMALRSVFRQDPDVIMIGEMRDAETISTALTAAETGHLVFATLHTNSAPQSIHRIVDSFPAEQQSQVRAQLSAALLGIVSQRLILSNKNTMIPACEVLFNNFAIANLIRENKIHEIPLVVDTSFKDGMISLNRSLANLVKSGDIDFQKALSYSLNPQELEALI